MSKEPVLSYKIHTIHVLTVGHQRFDTRIWIKEIPSLVAAGLQVRYIVADGAGDQTVNGVDIKDFGPIPGRSGLFKRLSLMYSVVRKSNLNKSDVVHFHDGAFLPFAFLLRMRGCKVIYDVHEDYPRQVLNSRFSALIKRIWSISFSLLEWIAGKAFHGIVAATPGIAKRFPSTKTVTVQNFPLMAELLIVDAQPYINRSLNAAFVGVLTKIRGAFEMVEAIDLVNKKYPFKLVFGGETAPKTLCNELNTTSGWRFVDALGFVKRDKVARILADTRLGLVLFHPAPNHIDAQPNKLFEYMSAGIPVIASDFPLWRQIVNGSKCGLLVDPLDPQAIADAICWLIEHPEEAEEMGRNGRKAVEEQYSWKPEEEKLLQFYRQNILECA